VTVDQRSMKDRMLAGDPYIPDDPEIVEMQAAAQDLMAAYNATSPRELPLRRLLLERLLAGIGEATDIRPPLHVDYGSNTTIGARCFVNFGLVVLDVVEVRVGDDCQIGPNVQLLTATHPLSPQARRNKWEAAEPVTIGHNVWLGAGVLVLPGVTIGDNTVVGAGAVVTRDLPPNVVAVGNPARVVREISDAD
jgi:maltose O-acetyltransferase